MAIDVVPENSPPHEAPPRKLSEELAFLQSTFAERAVELHEVITVLKGRAYLLLVLLIALPFGTPIPLPGLSTPFGLIIALIALRLALGQKPWLPERLQKTKLPQGFFGKLIAVTQRVVRTFEEFLRPRLLVVTGSGMLLQVHALVILVSALALLLPLPIPFTNMFPAWAILLVAAGLLERDGVFILAGYVVFAAGVVYFFLLGEAAQHLIEAARRWLFT